jgi:hypothetical protein
MSAEAESGAVEDFIERAAIMECQGGLKRATAESLALQYVSKKYGTAAAKACDLWRKANP